MQPRRCRDDRCDACPNLDSRHDQPADEALPCEFLGDVLHFFGQTQFGTITYVLRAPHSAKFPRFFMNCMVCVYTYIYVYCRVTLVSLVSNFAPSQGYSDVQFLSFLLPVSQKTSSFFKEKDLSKKGKFQKLLWWPILSYSGVQSLDPNIGHQSNIYGALKTSLKFGLSDVG